MSEELEKKILKGFIADNFTISRAFSEGFNPDYFENSKTKLILSAILDIYEGRAEIGVIDLETVKRQLEKKGLLDNEIKKTLDEIEKIEPPPLAVIISYIDILKIRHGERKLLEISLDMKDFVERRGPHKAEDIAQFASETAEKLHDIARERLVKKLVPSIKHMDTIIKELEGKRIFHGYSIEPFTSLDKTLLGLRPGFYYAIAGAPRRGKTNFLLHLALNVIKNDRVPVLFYSWEQTARILSLRILSQEAMINPVTILSGELNEENVERIKKSYETLQDLTSLLYIVEGTRNDTLEKIEAHTYNIMQSHRTDKVVLFLDYIQKIPTENLNLTLEEKVDEISGKIAMLSLKLNCPIVAISALDKEGCKLDEEGTDRPTMFHSTGGGDIEYDSDVAMVLVKNHKETKELMEKFNILVKNKELKKEDVPKIDIIDLYIDKNRDAPEGVSNIIQYLFFIESNKFIEIGYKDLREKYTYRKIGNIIENLKKMGIIKLNSTSKRNEGEMGFSGFNPI